MFRLGRGVITVWSILALSLAAPLAAHASTTPDPAGSVAVARLDTFTHRLTVVGWAYDRSAPAKSITVRLQVAGRLLGTVRAAAPSPRLDAARRIPGRHTFRLSVRWARRAPSVTATSSGAAAGPARIVDRRAVSHVQPPPGERIVMIAKRYVGRARYVEGGDSPRTGFDCSGYTKYAYARAQVHWLPHNAEAQRRMRGMRRIGVRAARPGDLVFYMSGGHAYHVAIYAGHHMQYAAATPKDGIRYQQVWSRDVQYRTDWH